MGERMMRSYATPISLVGAALVVSGGLALLLAPETEWLPLVNVALGALLVASAGLLNPELFKHYGRWLNAFWGSIMVLAIVVMVNFLADRYPQRLDMTEGQLHSLSQLTVQTLQTLETDVEAVAFMEGGKDEALRGLLEQFAVHGGERFSFEFVDPDRDPGRTRDYAVRSYNTLVIGAGEASRQQLTELTEKDLTNALLKVVRNRREIVYVSVGHGERGFTEHEQDMKPLRDRLLEIDYTVRDSLFLAREGDVPSDCSVLLIAGPRTPFLRTEVDAVRRYLARGGAVFLLIDPLYDTGLEELVGEWGVEVGDDFVIDTSGIGSLFGLDFTIPVVTSYDNEHPVTRQHRSGVMTFFELARSIRLDSVAVETIQASAAVLVKTSEASWGEVDLSVLREAGGEKTVSLDDVDLPGPVGLAVAVHDTVGAGGRLIVFGDSDVATGRYFGQQGNGDLVLNAISWLVEDESLISIRPREAGFNPIALTEGQSDFVFWLTIIIYPGIVAIVGFVVVSRKGRWSLPDLITAALGVVLSLGVLGVLNFMGDRYHIRVDLTEDQLYTLAPATQQVLQQVEAEGKLVNVKTFMSSLEGGRYQDLMKEFGNVTLNFEHEIVDPQKDALQVRQYGIRERGTSIIEVTGNGVVSSERISEQSEGALINAIRRAMVADERVVAFTGGHGEGQLTEVDGTGFSILNGRLKELNLEIKANVDPGQDALDGISLLAILGTKTVFSKDAVAAIGEYLKAGGDLLLLVDPATESGLEALLRNDYDIDIGDNFIVDLSGLGKLFGADVSVPVVLQYAEHPITERLARGTMSFFPWARSVSAVTRVDGAVELLHTDRNAWGESDLGVVTGDGGEVDYDAERDAPGPLSLAVAVTVDVDSSAGDASTRIIVFGDSDFASNQYFGEQANGELLVAAVRWLAEGEGNLEIPVREARFNPINLVGTAGSTVLWLSVFLLPFGVALSGFVIMLRRGYETYSSGFVSWLVYNFAATSVYYFIISIIGTSEGDLVRGEGFLLLALLCAGVAQGLFRRLPVAWPLALGTAIANAGLAFVVIPEATLQLVFAGLSISNGCILVWIRQDFQSRPNSMTAADSKTAIV
jgi:ABC-type uncharacterized transport system involved in gliding motility auxiliary subunit